MQKWQTVTSIFLRPHYHTEVDSLIHATQTPQDQDCQHAKVEGKPVRKGNWMNNQQDLMMEDLEEPNGEENIPSFASMNFSEWLFLGLYVVVLILLPLGLSEHQPVPSKWQKHLQSHSLHSLFWFLPSC